MMYSKTSHNNEAKGFTLIEFLFATALLGFMLSMTIVTFIGVFRFYIWAGTTRTNQASARQVMDTMTREIASHRIVSAAANSICLVDPNTPSPTTSKAILLNDSNVIETQDYSDGTCSTAVGDAKIISNDNLKVTSLVFTLVTESISPTRNSGNSLAFRQSAIINMSITNNSPGGSLTCSPGDNFCDQADFLTAISERQ